MRYLVFIRRTATGFSAEVPDLPGCVAAGKTVERTRANIAEAIAMHVELMRQSGAVVPAPTKKVAFALEDTADADFCTWVEVKTEQPVS
jgi:predicted RNase H-like HicB family nuclease